MKVCDIVQFYSPISGGVRTYIDEKIRYFATREDVEHVLIIPAQFANVHTTLSTRVHEIKSTRLIGSKSYRALLDKHKILRVVGEEEPDLIEVDDPYAAAWIALAAGERNNIPVVAFYHSNYPKALSRTFRKYGGRAAGAICDACVGRYLAGLYNRMDLTVVATPDFQHLLREMGVGRTRQISLGVDVRAFFPRSCRREVMDELQLSPDTVLLLYAGRLAREKNVGELVRMMELLREEGRAAHLLLLGDGELRHEVSRVARHCTDVTWLGYCDDRRRMARLFSAADLFVHAGMAETFGLVSVEAQACGVRVIAVRGGGLESTLDHEPYRILADTPLAEDLVQAVLRALGLRETEQDRRARAGRIASRYSWEQTFRRLTELYGELIARRNWVGSTLCTHEETEELHHSPVWSV